MASRPVDDDPSPKPANPIWLTPDAFLQRRGGVRRMAMELKSALECAGLPTNVVVDSDIRTRARTASLTARLAAQTRQQSALLRSNRAGVVHSLYYDMPLLGGRKAVVTVHDMMHERLNIGSPIVRWQKQRSIRRADAVVCVSERTARDLADMGIRQSGVQTIPLGISDSIVDPDTSPGDDSAEYPHLLYVGDRRHYKNFEVLIEALAACPELDDHRLVLVGGEPCSDEELSAWMNRRRGGAIEQRLDVTDARLGSLYRSAAALVITSRYEGFGLPLLEAMACGCPVASSGGGSLAEYDGGHAVRFDPDDPISCRESILCAIQSGTAQRAAAKDHARTFTWANTADRYIEVYERIGWKKS